MAKPPDPFHEFVMELFAPMGPVTVRRMFGGAGVFKDGLMFALADLAQRMSRLFGIECTYVEGPPVSVPDMTRATELYYIAHEAVSNAARHARARHISLCLRSRGGNGELLVTDDGADSRARPPADPGMGMRIMRYRAELIGATLSWESGGAGAGTVMRCTFPGPDSCDAGDAGT